MVSVITGGNTGIGRRIVEHFAGAGSNVVIGYYDEKDIPESIASAQSKGVVALAFPTDIRKSREVASMMQYADSQLGPINNVICNAAAQHCKPLSEMTDNEIEQIVHTNLIGTIYCIREAVQLMKQHSTEPHSIIVISSINAITTQIGLQVYGATKAALEGLTGSLSTELGQYGIRINAIRPGSTATERTLQIPNYERQWATVIPTGRVNQGDDIAELAVFLCSKTARQINGAILPIDGGQANVRPRPQEVKPG